MKNKLLSSFLAICMLIFSIYPNLVVAVNIPRLGVTSPDHGTVEIGGTVRYTVNIYNNATNVTLSPEDIRVSGVSANISVEGSGNLQRVIVLSDIQGNVGDIGYISYIAGGVATNEAGGNRELNITSTSFTIVQSYQQPESDTFIVKGDANGDGLITTEDANYINYLYEMGITVDDKLLEAADMDNNGKLTPYDAYLINLMLEKEYQKGDADRDGMITSKDADYINYLYEHLITVDDKLLKIADVNDDGRISPYDALLINVFVEQGCIKGDINKDGYVNSVDAAIVMNIYKNNSELTIDDLLLADMNSDNNLNSIDAALIMNLFKNNQ